jgi:hypothetical protein
MKSTSKSNRHIGSTPSKFAVLFGVGPWLTLPAPALAGDQECQNQAEIDICKVGCTVTGDVCGALCDFTSGACWVGCQAVFGTCEVGCGACDLGCDICCPTLTCNCGNCRDDCDDCHDACDSGRDDCEGACRLDCDDCIFDCERDCESICRPFKKVGESCFPIFDRCDEGLVCWPFPLPDQDGLQCFPSDNDALEDDAACRRQYSSLLHEIALADGSAVNFGRGGSLAAGVGAILESGVVYGPDGRFGCYQATCFGATTDIEVGESASIGSFRSYDDFRGQSIMIVEEAGEIAVFSLAEFLSTDGEFIGVADSVSLEISILPVSVGVYDCATIVDTVGVRDPNTGELIPVNNSPPTALCEDQEACAEPEKCVAVVTVDAGSTDPDADPLVLVQDPPGPYGIGVRKVMLTVSDFDGASDTCVADVQVNDCTPPDIECPPSVEVDCEDDGVTFLDPGVPDVSDCSEVKVTGHQPQEFPLGETTLTYTAEDAVGLTSSCEQTITVVSDDTDGDGLVDCLDQCPFITAFSPTGCGSALPGDTDGDGVPNGLDACPDTLAGQAVDESGCPTDEPPTQPVPDADGDGVPDDFDLCPGTPVNRPVDDDGCPIAPPVVDSDGDGVADDADLCPDTPAGVAVDADGCPIDEPPTQPLPDADAHGVPDDADLCADTVAGVEVDENGCPVDDDEGQPVPDDDGIVETPCGPIDVSALFLIVLGVVGLRFVSGRRR